MASIYILYNTKTGNTEIMAKAVEEGAKSVEGTQVTLSYHVSVDNLEGVDALIIGVPTYNHSMTVDIQNFLEKVAKTPEVLKGKIAATFGSYGWSGEAPKQVLEVLKNKFQMNIIETPILAKYKPDDKALESCRELGKNVAEKIF